MATEQLLLDGIGATDQWTLAAGSTKVVACQTPDNDATTYINSGTTAGQVQMFSLANPADIGSGDTINHVTVRWRHLRGGAPAGAGHSRITTSGGTLDGTTTTTGTAWADRSDQFTTRPGGGAWNLTALNELQAGVRNTQTRDIYCTTVEVIVDYTPAAAEHNLAAVLSAASNTPNDADLLSQVVLGAQLSGLSETPTAVVLGVARGLSAATAAASTTPDNAELEAPGEWSLAAVATAASSAPDNAVLDEGAAAADGFIDILAATVFGLSHEPTGAVNLSATVSALSNTSGAELAADRPLSAIALASSVTPDTSVSVERSMAAALTAASDTPTGTIAVERQLSAVATATSDTPAAGIVADRALSGTATSASLTPDSVTLEVTGEVNFSATISAASVTPDSLLVVERPLAATVLAQSDTPAGAIVVDRAFAGVALAASATPDSIGLITGISFSAIVTAESYTNSQVILEVTAEIWLQAACHAQSNTPSATLPVDRPLVGASLAASSTPAAAVTVSRTLTASSLAASLTPDLAVAAVARSMGGVALAASLTPDLALLVRSTALQAAALAGSATPDNVILETPGLVAFSAVCQVISSTPDLVFVEVGRSLAAIAHAASNAPVAILGVALPLSGSALSVSETPITSRLAVSRAAASSFLAASATPDLVALPVGRGLAAQAEAVSDTSIAGMIAVLAMTGEARADSFCPDSVFLIVTGYIELRGECRAESVAAPSVDLPVNRPLVAATTAVTQTTVVAVLGVSSPLSGLSVAASLSPDTSLLDVDRAMQAAADSSSDTGLGLLSVERPMTSVALAASLTPDSAEIRLGYDLSASIRAESVSTDAAQMLVTRAVAAVLLAASDTPAALLSVRYQLGAVIAAASWAPDNVFLIVTGEVQFRAVCQVISQSPNANWRVARPMEGLVTLVSSTPIATLGLVFSRQAQAWAASDTPLTSLVTVDRQLSASLEAGSEVGPGSLVVSRPAQGMALATSLAPDSAALQLVHRLFVGVHAESTSTDVAQLQIARVMTAALSAGSATPTALLSLSLQLSTVLRAVSWSPNNVFLTVTGEVQLRAVCQVIARGPNANWHVTRPMEGLAASVTSTHAAMLGLIYWKQAQVLVTSDTPSTSLVTVDRPLMALLEARSETGPALLPLEMVLAALMIAISQTSEPDCLTIYPTLKAMFRGFFKGLSKE